MSNHLVSSTVERDPRRLRECGRIVGGMTPSMREPSFWGGRIPWVSPKDMKLFEIADSEDHVTEMATRKTALTAIPEGSVLLVVRGMILARRVPVAVTAAPVTVNQDMKAIIPHDGVNGRFLAYALLASQDILSSMIDEAGHGTKRLPTTLWRDLPVWMPRRQEQEAIVSFLEEKKRDVEYYLATKGRMIEVLEEQKRRSLDALLFTDSTRVGWEIAHLPRMWRLMPFTKSVIEQADYRGATPTKTSLGRFLVTARNVRKGWIDYETSREYVSEEDYPAIMRRGLPRKGDILFTTEAPLGNVALVDREDIALAQRIIRFRMDPRLFRPAFALDAMLSSGFQQQLVVRGSGSTAEGIKASKLHELRLPCPPLEEQDRVADCIAENSKDIDNALRMLRLEIAAMEEYRTRLIADAVTGQIDVRRAT